MNRRDFFKGGFYPPAKAEAIHPKLSGLKPYSGDWGYSQAAHLLRRTMFGAKKTDVDTILSMSVDQAVDLLLGEPKTPVPFHPVKYLGDGSDYPGDPSDWTRLRYVDPTTDQGWFTFLQTWYFKQMLEQSISLQEKMILFWHNHFSTSFNTVKDARCMFHTHAILRSNALGNFKTLVTEITLDPGMLRYLNGNTNTKNGPNENYGRELQELFTIGKGQEISPGNYTTYCEADIKAAARVLTGWKDMQETVMTIFSPEDHDSTDKQFSKSYSNQVIQGRNDEAGAREEVDELITMILDQEATAQYICRKIYRWFVSPNISDEVEAEVIIPLAAILKREKYEMRPMLKTLFTSSHFYDASVRGSIIKNPIDLGVGLMRTCTTSTYDVAGNYSEPFPSNAPPLPSEVGVLHYALRPFRVVLAGMQMDLLNPPSVAGFPAYYQMPQLHKLWINSDTLQRRVKLMDDLVVTHFKYETGYGTALINAIEYAKECSNPSDAEQLVSDIDRMLFAIPLSDSQKKSAVAALLDSQSSEQWSNDWNQFVAAPTSKGAREVIEIKVRSMLRYLTGLGEFQLM